MPGPNRDIPEYSYATRRQRPEVDPALRRIALGAGGFSIFVIAVALLWSGVKPHIGFGPPPEITAPDIPLRVAPQDPGGLTVPGANEQIMSGDDSSAPPQLAPAAPPPDISQLQLAAGLPVQNPAPPAPVAAVAIQTPAAPPPAAATGQVEVQLASESGEDGVQKAWAALQAQMPGLLADKSPVFVPSVVNGQSVWRLRLSGFPSAAAAQAFCAQVIAKGAACSAAAF